MTALYWAGEYAKVLGGYLFLMFLWPAAVFGGHLRGKPKIYQFSFCSVVQIVLLNTLVLGLGLLHILNRFTVDLVLYGLFFAALLRRVPWNREALEQLYRLLVGTCGKKLFFSKLLKQCIRWTGRKLKILWQIVRPRLVEYILLLALLIYAMIYFSWGAFQNYSYGFSDLYVHHAWTYGLVEGKAFAGSVYPEGMHCFVYSLYALFGIRIYSILLFLQSIHVMLLLLCAYCLMREVFHWRYTPLIVLLLFVMVKSHVANSIYGVSRLQSALPLEFSLHTQFVCALFLVRYLKSAHVVSFKKHISKCYWDENLFLFMMALAAAISVHFYAAMMAFFLCACFALCMLSRLLDKRRLLPLIAAALCGFSLAVLPIAGGLVSGTPFHSSMDWAISVMEGRDTDRIEEVVSEEKDGATEPDQGLKDKLLAFYEDGYGVLYPQRKGWIAGLTLAAGALCLIYQAAAFVRRRFFRRPAGGGWIPGYLPVVLASVTFMLLYASSAVGLPQIIAGSRVCTSIQLLVLMVMLIPLDMLCSLLALFTADALLQGLSVAALGIMGGWVVLSGNYHSYLYGEFTRYNAAVRVTHSIIRSFPENSYTVVSPTEELYQLIEHGRHEELLTFLKNVSQQEEGYKIPTEHVFLFVEKKPIRYAQFNFYSGPSWLAQNEYVQCYRQINTEADIDPSWLLKDEQLRQQLQVSTEFYSQYPDVIAFEISEAGAQQDISQPARDSDAYADPVNRTILESKLYLWCQAFSQAYPFEMNVYYEDDSLVCYSFQQNTNALYGLNLEGWEDTDDVCW